MHPRFGVPARLSRPGTPGYCHPDLPEPREMSTKHPDGRQGGTLWPDVVAQAHRPYPTDHTYIQAGKLGLQIRGYSQALSHVGHQGYRHSFNGKFIHSIHSRQLAHGKWNKVRVGISRQQQLQRVRLSTQCIPGNRARLRDFH